jgi:hypothetical protein
MAEVFCCVCETKEAICDADGNCDNADCIELICDCNVDMAEVFCCVCETKEAICDADGKEDSIDCI